jgi:hypothetical protein
MAGIGDYTAKPFSLKSGNKPQFKMMGSSPLKQIPKAVLKKDKPEEQAMKEGGNRAKQLEKHHAELLRGNKRGISGAAQMMGKEQKSPMRKAGCAPGDPGCGGNFKVKKKGTVVSRALKKAGRWISSEIKDMKSDIRRKRQERKRRKNMYDSGGGSHKTTRYL